MLPYSEDMRVRNLATAVIIAQLDSNTIHTYLLHKFTPYRQHIFI
jgi:hypothetical protein